MILAQNGIMKDPVKRILANEELKLKVHTQLQCYSSNGHKMGCYYKTTDKFLLTEPPDWCRTAQMIQSLYFTQQKVVHICIMIRLYMELETKFILEVVIDVRNRN